ncbi:BrnT family toxin [Rhizobium sp. AAP116]|nr:BrnT family toxin [Rhizobium sp. AAP116]
MSIGAIQGLIVIAVIHTDRDGTTRIISARLADRSERQKYHDHLGRSS